MNKNIIKFGIIPIILILVAFSYATLADETTENGIGIEIEYFSPKVLTSLIDPIDPSMENVIAFDISKGQDPNDFTSFFDDLEIIGYTIATIDIESEGIPDNVEKLIIASLSNDYALDEPYTQSEAELVADWVNYGGELMVLAEWSPFTYLTEEICEEFDVTQNSDVISDSDDYDSSNIWVIYDGYNLYKTHPILYDVDSVEFLASCSLDTTDGVIIRSDDDGTATPSDAPVAIAKEWGDGRVAIFGDYDWVTDLYGSYDLEDNSKLALNTIIWLNGIITPPPGATCTDLIAGQTDIVGSVCVWNDQDDIHVLYSTIDDWYILETHLQVNLTESDIPQTKPGNPIPGHFEFSDSFYITDFVNQWYVSFPIPDDMEYGDWIVIAAHAKVAHTLDGCMDIISDITTQSMGLTSGKAEGDSFYAWEHPAWSTPKLEFNLGAEWIWESEYVFDPEIDNWVFFTKEFEIPGLYLINIQGDMKITCDNEYYTLSVNWLTVGSDDIWQTVETYDISDKLDVGLNEIEIIAKNLGVEGSTTTTNPGGLIYESEVCYKVVDQEESAWGNGHQFSPHPKRNWGMYFDYKINNPPVAVISPVDESFPWCEQPINFIGSGSYDPDGDTLTYFWDFGDGTTSTTPDPSHTYTSLDTFIVTLTVTDTQGAFDTEETTITIYNNPPEADFHYEQPYSEWCEPIHFWDDSTDADTCDSLSYFWDFGDGSTSTDKNPFYTYSIAGEFYVTLTVTDGWGATDWYMELVIVYNQPPYADFQYNPYDAYWCEEVEFDASIYSYDPDICDEIVLYEWDFESDGTYDDTGAIVYYTFPAEGDYDVTLRVTDGSGATDENTQMINVENEPPYADFDWNPYYPYWCEEVEFDGTWSMDYDICDSIILYEWDFDDDGTYDYSSVNPLAYNTFPAYEGYYPVTLRVTDEAGATDTRTYDVEVTSEPPNADFDWDPYDPYWCDEVEFDASWSEEYDLCDSIVSYEWDFDNDGIYDDEGIIVYYTFGEGGDFPVRLKVTDESGQFDYRDVTIYVMSEAPHADFDWQPWDPYEDELVEFDGGYSWEYDICDSIVSYEWDFDDDGSYDDTGIIAYYTFSTTGPHDVTLRVTDETGLTDTRTQTVDVYEIPPD